MTPTGFVLAASVCLIVAAALAAWPLLRPRTVVDAADRRGTNVGLYRQRVEEIERDREAGLLTADAAASLTQELAATLLDDAAANDTEIGSSGRSVWAAVAVVAAVAVISLSMYRELGAYDAVQLGESAKVLRQADADPTALGDLVMRLRSRVAATPSDLESWYLLGHTLMRLDDAPGAVSAFERVYAEESDDPSVQVASSVPALNVQVPTYLSRGSVPPVSGWVSPATSSGWWYRTHAGRRERSALPAQRAPQRRSHDATVWCALPARWPGGSASTLTGRQRRSSSGCRSICNPPT